MFYPFGCETPTLLQVLRTVSGDGESSGFANSRVRDDNGFGQVHRAMPAIDAESVRNSETPYATPMKDPVPHTRCLHIGGPLHGKWISAPVPASGSENCPSRSRFDVDEDRQTGRTTRQIINAPHGAIYVWPEKNSIFYPKRIARDNGRDDLEIITPEQLHVDRIRSRSNVHIVIDHAAPALSADGLRALEYAESTHKP
jgi:hypothetical protein